MKQQHPDAKPEKKAKIALLISQYTGIEPKEFVTDEDTLVEVAKQTHSIRAK